MTQDAQMIHSDFELAEVMWEAADPCMSGAHREAALIALHTGEPCLAILVVATALARSGYPLPADVHAEFTEWLRELSKWEAHINCACTQHELHVLAADIRVCPETTIPDRRFGDSTLCYFVLDDAGVADASHERQAEVLRKWLDGNRPSPSLRTDMFLNGFGYLLAPDYGHHAGDAARPDRRRDASGE